MTTDIHEKCFGALSGGAVGDAVGEIAFSHPDREALLAQLDEAAQLRYTDDTVMTLAVAENLIDRGDIDAQLLGNRLKELYHQEPWRGYGESARHIFSLVENEGIGYLDAARRLQGGAGSFGNGAAMRIAPVALYGHRSDDLYQRVATASRMTHAHPIGIDGAAVLAKAQALALGMNPQRPFSPHALAGELLDFAETPELKEKLELIPGLLDSEIPASAAADQLGLSTAAHKSVPFALYCFVAHPHEFMECVLCAVLNGGDRDTMGAMAGSVSGAFLGIGAIPTLWLSKLENRQHIEALSRELAARC